MQSGVYQIVHTSGKRYVGSSVNVFKRWTEHRKQLNGGYHHSLLLQRAWDKYEASSFTFAMLEKVSDLATLLEREQAYLDKFSSYIPAHGYNRSRTAAGSGVPCSEELKSKLRLVQLGNKHHTGMKVSVSGRALMSQRAIARCQRERSTWILKCDGGFRSQWFGKVFGRWTLIDPYTPENLNSSTLKLRCRCACGIEIVRSVKPIYTGKSTQCRNCSKQIMKETSFLCQEFQKPTRN